MVFTSEVGTPLDPSSVRRTQSIMAREAGLEHLHPHMLRHAAPSLLAAAGVTLHDISDTLGHRSVAITAEFYRHPIAPLRSGHMAAMNQLLPGGAEHWLRTGQWPALLCQFWRNGHDPPVRLAPFGQNPESSVHSFPID